MADCPRCSADIGNALVCNCGWRKRQRKTADKPPPEPTAPCAYMSCQTPSICKVRVAKNAWSNFCEKHYLEWHQRKAEESCHALGLKTMAEKRVWLKHAVATLAAKMRPNYLREPGDDDEEKVA